jgi:hypothetical protein
VSAFAAGNETRGMAIIANVRRKDDVLRMVMIFLSFYFLLYRACRPLLSFKLF